MNMTQLANGEWYSHLNDEIFRNQKLLGMKYQHYLALEVQKLGYEIEQRSHGQFDIKGYTESDLNDFSKRRMQILARAGVNASWAEREKAWKKTRRNKENVSPEELKTLWREEAAALGLEIVKPGVPTSQKDCAGVDEKIFADAIKYCSERRVAFKAEDIQAFILSESRPVDITSIEPLISNSDELIRIEQKNGCRYTTITAIERELATINLMKAGQRKENAIASQEVVEQHLADSNLNFGQRQAVMMTLTSSNSFVAWQGVAGAGKTFALKQVKEIAQAQGYTVKGFAPSAKASKVLGEEIVTQTQTVARLLAHKSPELIEPNQLWVVDEAGL
jgi:ATP-dependent exoDNAse (exonuclease V) alpha subunit